MPNPNPQPPKKKRRSVHSRHVKGGKRKKTTYDYTAARDIIGDPEANSQTITAHVIQSGPNPPAAKSPLKSEYKSMLKQKEEEVNMLVDENAKLRQNLTTRDSKISAQKQKIYELSHMLREEKIKSRAVITKLMDDADLVMAEAYDLKAESEEQMAVVDSSIERAKQKHREMINKERHEHSKELTTCEFIILIHISSDSIHLTYFQSLVKLKHTKQLKKIEYEYEAAATRNKEKNELKMIKWKDRLESSLNQVVEEKAKWQKKLEVATAELEKAKDQVYIQKVKHREYVQQRLNDIAENDLMN